MIKRVCVYCASSAKINKIYFDATEKLANYLADENIEVVCGGGSSGLMGKLADTMLAKGGRIIGIMPRFMKDVEWCHTNLTEIHLTETMHERKQKFLEDTDGLITLAGGCGTLEELLEAITLKRLGLFTKPIVILNTNGYYEPLRQMLNRSIEENFMSELHRKMWAFVNEPEDVLKALNEAPEWNADSIEFAVIK